LRIKKIKIKRNTKLGELNDKSILKNCINKDIKNDKKTNKKKIIKSI
jgi:hypothetical protein